MSLYVMFCAIWFHLYTLKNVKNIHGRVLLLVNLRALLKVTLLYGCFSRFFKLHKSHQISQNTTCYLLDGPIKSQMSLAIFAKRSIFDVWQDCKYASGSQITSALLQCQLRNSLTHLIPKHLLSTPWNFTVSWCFLWKMSWGFFWAASPL